MLTRPNRLNRKQDFDRLFNAGKAVHETVLSLRAAPNDSQQTRLGFSCGKRVGGAVIRNRARRRLQEAARILLSDIPPGWDILLTVQPKGALASTSEFGVTLRRLLQRRGLWAEPEKT